ncbi:hypothetical protein ES754_09905 [Psychrobacter frigidicola]|uniref:DUF4878 domain-containing protein n=1 Tax=Psychrobacter frigidicola TaxID=45611 RepID=A0A5C7A1W3_9GAMM|nr:hypothetical protein [Psychrobacter frigidicola]TXD96448.1 hypothetical protein ES754_09905 [Psychrobacter frigidicola]
MKARQLSLQKLPMVIATGVLSAGLLLSGCSNSDNNEANNSTNDDTPATKVTTEDSSKVDETQNLESDTATDLVIAKNNEDDTKVATDGETVSKTISPIAAATKQPSLLTNPTQAGSAEDTVKLALDTLYYGDIEKAATYYQVDMEDFAEELKNTQFAFQQTVEAVTITNTKYNSDKTRATVTGELMLKGQDQPAPLTYELQKIAGKWKILG